MTGEVVDEGGPGTAILDALSPERLLADASSAAGLTDWGDLSFSTNLALLVESCRATAGLTPAGRDLLRKVAIRHLRNRLYLQAYLTAHRGAGRTPITSPLVITGLPRTGTTMLHNLLAQDPGNRVLQFWQALHPVPPDPDRGESVERLVSQAESWLQRTYALTPALRVIHGATARGPEECDSLLQNAFASQHFDDMFRAEAYSRWLNRAALIDEYAYYALQLRVLAGAECGQRWVLKSPSHLGYLDTVMATFPGALIVHCHRDPTEAMASYASLVLAVRSPHTSEASTVAVGRHVLDRCSIALQRAMQVRAEMGEDRFVDVAYPRLVLTPLDVVRSIYQRWQRPITEEVTEAMQRWLSENPQHRYGRHAYTLEAFGLSSSQVSTGLDGYRERFGHEIA